MTAASLAKLLMTSQRRLVSPEALEQVGAVNLGAMAGREARVGQKDSLGLIHLGGKLGDPHPGLIGDLTPLFACRLGVVQSKGGANPCGDETGPCLAGIGHRVTHEVYPALLPGGAQHFDDCGLQSVVQVEYDQLDTAQTMARERPQDWVQNGSASLTRPTKRRVARRPLSTGAWCWFRSPTPHCLRHTSYDLSQDRR